MDGWLQWLDAVNVQAEAFLEDSNAAHAKAILRDGLGRFRECHPKAPSLLQPGVVRSLNNLARTYVKPFPQCVFVTSCAGTRRRLQ